MKLAAFAVVALAGLALVRLAVAILVERRATRTFWRSLEDARNAGVEEAFMARFNSAASHGNSLDKIIQGWGATRIRHMYEEAVKQ